MKEVAVRDVHLSWGPATRASGLFNFILSRGPRVRVTLIGVRLQLAPQPPPTTTPTTAPASPSLDTATSPSSTPVSSASNATPSKEGSSKEESTHPSIYFLNLIILELHDVAVVDEVSIKKY